MHILRKAWKALVKKRPKLSPLGNKVVVKRFALAQRTDGGVYLPAQKGTPNEGEVIAVGPGKLLKNGQRVRPSLRKGDWVIFGLLAGVDVEVEGESFVILDADEIEACW